MTLQRRLWVFKGGALVKENTRRFDPGPGRCVWMGEGPKPKEEDKCGPDVTLALANTLTRIRTVFEGWGNWEKILKCNIGTGYLWGNHWEIKDLHANAFEPWIIDGVTCPTGNCQGTVMVDGGCFHSYAVKYIAFGFMSRLCAEGFLPANLLDLLFANGVVWLYNTFMSVFDPDHYNYGDHDEKIPWVEAGFNYWPASSTPVPPASTEDCATCPHPAVSGIMGWQWANVSEESTIEHPS